MFGNNNITIYSSEINSTSRGGQRVREYLSLLMPVATEDEKRTSPKPAITAGNKKVAANASFFKHRSFSRKLLVNPYATIWIVLCLITIDTGGDGNGNYTSVQINIIKQISRKKISASMEVTQHEMLMWNF